MSGGKISVNILTHAVRSLRTLKPDTSKNSHNPT